ncbi:MAG: hypothetical protein LBU27_00840, partial [Candidatus Peribacteria bacterium]|nr:hypothetical protein [Candidatus Peribacteria bacterium]
MTNSLTETTPQPDQYPDSSRNDGLPPTDSTGDGVDYPDDPQPDQYPDSSRDDGLPRPDSAEDGVGYSDDPQPVEPPYQGGSDEVAGDLVEEILSDTLFSTSAVTNASSTYPGCNHVDLTVDSYTIAACNVGATVAGTSVASYGSWFQWGNNYEFENNGNSITPTTTAVNT